MPKKSASKSPRKRNKRGKKGDPILTNKALKQCIEWTGAGYTQEEIAKFIGVTAQAITNTKRKNEEFRLAMGKAAAEKDKLVEQALIKRCLGMRVSKEKAGFDKGVHIDTAKIYEEIPPDVTAIQFWLRNRQPEKYREKSLETPITQVLTVVSTGKKTEFDV